MTASQTRVESDLLGEIAVPEEALYGAQTQRAVLNFPLRAERPIGRYPPLIEGLLLVKQAAASAGELDLNVWESTIVFNVLDSMELLSNATAVFADKCVQGLTVDVERNAWNAETIMPLLANLTTRHGYSRVSDLCRRARGDIAELRRLLQSENLL